MVPWDGKTFEAKSKRSEDCILTTFSNFIKKQSGRVETEPLSLRQNIMYNLFIDFWKCKWYGLHVIWFNYTKQRLRATIFKSGETAHLIASPK